MDAAILMALIAPPNPVQELIDSLPAINKAMIYEQPQNPPESEQEEDIIIRRSAGDTT